MMHARRLLAAALGAWALTRPALGGELRDRTFEFVYRVEVAPPPAGTGSMEVFVPLARSDAHQRILKREIQASVQGAEGTDPKEGNLFWYGRADRPDGKPTTVMVRYQVERKVFRGGARAKPGEELSPAELERYLGADRLVPVTGPLVERIRKDLPRTDGSVLAKARGIYDYVLANMEYKKVGTGLGHGSTEWACSTRYGNCTDFHALFTSVARAEGIPARFEIGFPIPESPGKAQVAGYHCWVEIWVPAHGWFPIDASEGWKNKDKRDLFFGTYPADRIQFTVGRDLVLGDQRGPPLNYFIYPYVEVDGKPYAAVKAHFEYVDLPTADFKLE